MNAPDNRARWALAGVIALAAALRLPGLGTMSPWIDELLIWNHASTHGMLPRPGTAHPATQVMAALGLAWRDDLVGLRLGSVVFGMASVALAAWWALRRAGLWPGVAVGVMMAASPAAVFYSRDATHYAPIMFAGVCMLVLVDVVRFVRWKLAWGVALFVPILLAPAFHPAGWMLWLVAGGIGVLAMEIRPGKDPGCLPVIVLAGLVIAFLIGLVIAGLEGPALQRYHPAPRPGPDATFWALVLASTYGGLLSANPIGIFAGILGVMATVRGWWLFGRDRDGGLLVMLSAAVIVGGTIVPLLWYGMERYFFPRYFIAALPAVIIGAGIAVGDFAEALARRRSQSGDWLVIPAFAIAIVLAWTGSHVDRARAPHQPIASAVDYLAEQSQAPGGMVVVTRDHYTNLAFAHLQSREPALGAIEHCRLSWTPFSAEPALGALHALVQDEARPVYFLTFSKNEFRLAPALRSWIDTHTIRSAQFASSTQLDFAPIDWSVTVWQLTSRGGDDPDWRWRLPVVYPLEHASTHVRQPVPRYTPGAAPRFDVPAFDTPGATVALRRDAQRTIDILIGSDRDGWRAWHLPPSDETTVHLVHEALRGGQFHVLLPIDIDEEGSSAVVQRVTPGVDSLALTGRRMTEAPPRAARPLSPVRLDVAVRQDGLLHEWWFDVPADTPPGAVVMLEAVVGGLDDTRLIVELQRGEAVVTLARRLFVAPEGILLGAMLPDGNSTRVVVRIRAARHVSYTPRVGDVVIGPPRLFIPEQE